MPDSSKISSPCAVSVGAELSMSLDATAVARLVPNATPDHPAEFSKFLIGPSDEGRVLIKELSDSAVAKQRIDFLDKLEKGELPENAFSACCMSTCKKPLPGESFTFLVQSLPGEATGVFIKSVGTALARLIVTGGSNSGKALACFSKFFELADSHNVDLRQAALDVVLFIHQALFSDVDAVKKYLLNFDSFQAVVVLLSKCEPPTECKFELLEAVRCRSNYFEQITLFEKDQKVQITPAELEKRWKFYVRQMRATGSLDLVGHAIRLDRSYSYSGMPEYDTCQQALVKAIGASLISGFSDCGYSRNMDQESFEKSEAACYLVRLLKDGKFSAVDVLPAKQRSLLVSKLLRVGKIDNALLLAEYWKLEVAPLAQSAGSAALLAHDLFVAEKLAKRLGFTPDAKKAQATVQAFETSINELIAAKNLQDAQSAKLRLAAFKHFLQTGSALGAVQSVMNLPSGYSGKFMLIKISDEESDKTEKLFVRGVYRAGCSMHAQIMQDVCYEISCRGLDRASVTHCGGASIEIPTEGAIIISGYSMDYGKCDDNLIAPLIAKAFPGREIEFKNEAR